MCHASCIVRPYSEAFDTVNHEIHINRLQNEVGLQGAVLNWFKSYLSDRGQRISVSRTLSACFNLDCGVPQALVWDCYCLFHSSQLFDVLEKHLPCVHCFADDIQLY